MVLRMKTVCLFLVFWFGLTNNINAQFKKNEPPSTLRELLNYSKKGKISVSIRIDKPFTDSLDILLNEKYDLSGVKVHKVSIGQDDSINTVRLLNFLKPISSSVLSLYMNSNIKYDISQFVNLNTLYLTYSGLSDNKSIQSLQTIKNLFIGIFNSSQQKIVLDKSNSIFKLKNITTLFLEINHPPHLLDINLNDLVEFTMLTCLNLRYQNLTHIPESWANMSNLSLLTIYCSVNDDSFNTIFKLPKITSIKIISFGFCPDIDVELLRKNMYKRKSPNYACNYFELRLFDICTSIEQKQFKKIGKKLVKMRLEYLNIHLYEVNSDKGYSYRNC